MKQFSYIPATVQADHYVLGGVGSLPKVVLRSDGQWLDVVPPFEAQAKQIETFDCSGFGTLNCIEILGHIQGYDFNLSDRYMGIVAGTDPKRGGNDPHTVAEALRHYGAIAEADLPFDDSVKTVEEFYSFKGNDEQSCREAGDDFTKAWTIGHEWVKNGYVGNSQELMKEGLTYSPLGAAGPAWFKDPITGLFISPKNAPANHWFQVVGYVEGQYWIINDSYLEDGIPIKHLAWDFDFGCVKRYHFVKNAVWKKQPWYQGISNFFNKLYGKLFK